MTGHNRAAVPAWPREAFTCAACRLSYLGVPVPDAVASIRSVPGAVGAAVTGVPPGARALRPGAGVWSVTEYVCHLRDVYTAYTIRLHRSTTEDGPVLDPMFNDLRAERFRYNERDASVILDELGATAAGFCDEVARIAPGSWGRLVRRAHRDRESRTARWLVRQVVHEGRHHLRDIQEVAAAVARRAPDAGVPPVEGN